MDLGMGEILLILVVALLVYGGRLPDVARAIGRSIGELKRGMTETRDAVTTGLTEAEEPQREVRRTPAPRELATEDITKPDPPAPKHENPN